MAQLQWAVEVFYSESGKKNKHARRGASARKRGAHDATPLQHGAPPPAHAPIPRQTALNA
jgi:hypothetical protein